MFKTLLSVRLSAYFAAILGAGRSKKPSTGRSVLFALLFLYVIGVFLSLFFGFFSALAVAAAGTDYEWLYFSMFAMISFGLMFIGTVMTTKAQLFSARDNELLLSMPVTPSAILGSRMAILALMNLLFGLIAAVPCFAAWQLRCGFSAWQAVRFWLSVPILSLLALALSCLFAWLISLLTAKMRNQALFTTVFSLLFLGAYFFAVGRLNVYMNELIANAGGIAASLAPAVPIYLFGCGILGQRLLPFFGLLSAMLAAFAAVYAILAKNFFRIVGAKAAAPKREYRETRLKVSSVQSSLVRKELSKLLSSSGYLLNAGLGAFSLVVFAVALPFLRGRLAETLSALGITGEYLTVGAIGAICLLLCTVTISASSVSLEAKTLPILKAMPVTPQRILLAKLSLHSRISMAAAIVCSVSAVAFLKTDAVFTLLIPVFFARVTAAIGLIANLRHPNFTWLSETQCVKQGISVLIAMFLSVALLAISGLLYFLVLKSAVPVQAFLSVMLVLLALLDRLLLRRITGWGAEVWNTLC